MLDKIMKREEMLSKSDEEVFKVLDGLYPEHQLFAQSVGWRESEEFILKAKGVYGDVIIGWEGVHDEPNGSVEM